MAAHCHAFCWSRWVTPLLVLALLGLLCASITEAQPVFKKHLLNPVLIEGPDNAWDDRGATPLAILARGLDLHLWYQGWDGTSSASYCQTGYARSTDGIQWAKHSAPVIPVGTQDWDSYDITPSNVLLDGSRYKMWPTVAGPPNPLWSPKVSYASAADETSWVRSSQVVLGPGPAGKWDGQAAFWASVLPASAPNSHMMWYTGWDGTLIGSPRFHPDRIGLATATDETTWTKYAYNPVFSPGPPGAWDDGAVFLPRVLRDTSTGVYHMFYAGRSLQKEEFHVGYASSVDGVTWKRLPHPVLSPGPPGSWDERGTVAGWVVIVQDTFHLWYGGWNGARWRGGRATMPVSHVAATTVRRVPRYYPTIQAAIDASGFGDTVLVYEGTYRENIRFRGKSIVVGSLWLMDKDTAHIAMTIIDGSGSTVPDSGSTVMFVDGEDTTSVLAGFTITGGSGTSYTYTGLPWPYRSGGGVFCVRSGARITHNVIARNRIAGPGALGGGVAAITPDASEHFVILEQNFIGDNLVVGTSRDATNITGGGAAFSAVSARVTGNIFERDSVRGALVSGGGLSIALNDFRLPTIHAAGNILRANVALGDTSRPAYGGGVFAWGTKASRLEGNQFERNIARSTTGGGFGGGLAVIDGRADAGKKIISSNRFIENSAAGKIETGGGGGLYVRGGRADITGNIISANAAEGLGGGAYLYESAFSFVTNIVTANYSNSWGGGLYAGFLPDPSIGTEQSIINNTFSKNVAKVQGGGIVLGWTESRVVLLNNILWQDSAWNAREIYTDGNVTLNVHYCAVQGGIAEGTHNINGDPLFVVEDPIFNLSTASPCIGAGTDSFQVASTWYRAPSCDCDGHALARPSGTRPDIGAQEEQIIYTVGLLGDDETPWTYSLSQNYPNPFNPTTVIGYQLPSAGEVRLVVYDLLGREIKLLVNEKMPAGTHTVEFDGGGLSSGVYFYRLSAGSFIQSRGMILLK